MYKFTMIIDKTIAVFPKYYQCLWISFSSLNLGMLCNKIQLKLFCTFKYDAMLSINIKEYCEYEYLYDYKNFFSK